MSRTRGFARMIAPLLAALSIVGGCSAPPPVAEGEPTRRPLIPFLAPATPTPTPSPSPTPRPMWPLAGFPAPDHAAIGERPLIVRMPNDPSGRPQVGLAKADLVFEMIVEGGITRYAVVYHSEYPQTAGPTRSYRLSDIYIGEMLSGALVASGATNEERDAVNLSIRDKLMVRVDPDSYGAAFFRTTGRGALNNLMVNVAKAREGAKALGGPAPVQVPSLKFLPSGAHDPAAGGFGGAIPARTVTIPFQRDPATFTWDEAAKGYRRAQAGVRTVDPDGNAPVLAQNVVVMWTDITITNIVQDIFGSLGLDYRMRGSGYAAVFRDGRRQEGSWTRNAPGDMFTFKSHAGEEIALNPGQTWIHFVYPNWQVPSTP